MSDKIEDKMIEARSFYNAFQNKFIKDYLTSNSRMESAIRCAKSWIDSEDVVLDLGCGLGWSSNEFAQLAKHVDAIDLSDAQIRLARTLFRAPNLAFKNVDITTNEFGMRINYDVIVMLDVYEHIPKNAREGFNSAVGKLMKDGAKIFLSCPSAYHQEHLAKTNPKSLQPVDEKIRMEDLLELASTLEGEIIFYEYVDIWRPKDYFYVVIEKRASNRHRSKRKPSRPNEAIGSRIRRVKRYVDSDEIGQLIIEIKRDKALLNRIGRKLKRLLSPS